MHFMDEVMQYRPEIDGLRALAVLPVLFFHAGFPGFSGGFVGVDVFFVLSGFLITGILLHENEQRKYSLINFYERRARRLIPAFFFVLLASTLAALLLLGPSELVDFGKSLSASSLVFANYHFLNTLNYFSTAAEELPLLHIWSLSVEEQFYVVFPVLLALCYQIFRSFRPRTMAYLMCWSAFLLSFAYMHLLDTKGYSNIAFFSVISRTWELLAGGLLAFHIQSLPKTRLVQETGSLAGLVFLVASILLLDASSGWPDYKTLLPVFATVLLIGFTSKKTFVGHILTLRAVRWIGLISYSLYLWHQPVYAFLRVTVIGHPTATAFIIATLLSIALATITYHYIEEPFRNKNKVTRGQSFSFAILGLLLLASCGYMIQQKDGLPLRYASLEKHIDIPVQTDRRCIRKGKEFDFDFSSCIRNPERNVTWAVLGDSHSNEIALSLSKRMPTEGLLQLSFSGCSPAWTFDTYLKGCGEFTLHAMNKLLETDSIRHVVLAYRHSLHVRGELHVNSNPESPSSPGTLPKDGKDDDMTTAGRYNKNFISMTQALTAAGKKVHVVTPFPELPDDINRLALPYWVFSSSPRGDLDRAVTKEEYDARHQWWFSLSDALRNNSDVRIVSSWDAVCEDLYCSAITPSGRAAYYDDDHLSFEAVKPITSKVIRLSRE